MIFKFDNYHLKILKEITMSNQTLNDILDTPYIPPTPEIWGQVGMALQQVALIKGVGKVPYDPSVHKNAVLAIDMSITPLPGVNNDQTVERNMIRESREWGLVQASIQDAGLNKASELNGRFVHLVLEPTGDTYVNKDGQTRNKTYPKFIKVFSNEQECMANYQSNGGAHAPVAPNGNGADKDRATALAFLRPIVENACYGQTDLNVILQTITVNLAGMPLVNKFFTANSPETLALINEFIAKK